MNVPERLQAFQAKLSSWKKILETNNFANLPMLEEGIYQSRIDNTEALASFLRGNMSENLDILQQSYRLDDVNFEFAIHFLQI